MNKQQLAAKIWESANQMRSKIEANDYKDYILGFIFYKYLSDKLVNFVTEEGMTAEDIKSGVSNSCFCGCLYSISTRLLMIDALH